MCWLAGCGRGEDKAGHRKDLIVALADLTKNISSDSEGRGRMPCNLAAEEL